MKKLPMILVSSSTEKRGVEFGDVSMSLSARYTQSILAGGGLPMVLPGATDPDVIAEYVRRSDGVLLTGGDDLNPQLYTRRLEPLLARTVGKHDCTRDLYELMLIEEVFRQRKPLLAICRGHQLLNVALGGTLVVDIPTQIPDAINHNRLDAKNVPVHEVKLTPDSMLAKITGKPSLMVNSSHHQAVNRVAGALRVTARSNDGVVEGMEFAPAAMGWLPYLVAVQYHPERLTDRYEEHLNLFRSFAHACARHRRKIL